MNRGSLHTISFRRKHFSVFRFIWTKNDFTDPIILPPLSRSRPQERNTLIVFANRKSPSFVVCFFSLWVYLDHVQNTIVVYYWPRKEPIEMFWLCNSCIVYDCKTKGCAWSKTFQHKSCHLWLLLWCLPLWCLPGFSKLEIEILYSDKLEVLRWRKCASFAFGCDKYININRFSSGIFLCSSRPSLRVPERSAMKTHARSRTHTQYAIKKDATKSIGNRNMQKGNTLSYIGGVSSVLKVNKLKGRKLIYGDSNKRDQRAFHLSYQISNCDMTPAQ